MIVIPNDSGTALAIYRGILDKIRSPEGMSAEDFIVCSFELERRCAAGNNGVAAFGFLMRRLTAQWITYNVETEVTDVPAVPRR